MRIFPAIDIKDKKCVRLIKGDFNQKTEYEMSPVEQATQFIDKGFKNLHIVDLDGALNGETVNLNIIKEIVRKFDFKVEVGGGVRDFDSIQEYADIGVDKVILGSAAIKDKNFLKKACKRFPKKIALGLDAKDGTKESPNFEETLKVAEISNCPVVISGGVSSIEDIKKAKTLKNVEGVIVGKAIYDGDVKLEELAKEDA